ncbi:MAG TPA: DUF1080 domain-containing protein [Gemmatimonadetes bacterium]|nr:DUF1080 domain-containing protein [Gemmatimonadota bacterium]HIN77691.1 DUF1080 domain-containing protein [Gemmatimonadota bacterium]
MRILILLIVALGSCESQQVRQDMMQLSSTMLSPDEDDWIALFNGSDLTGWTPKIRGNELGEDPGGTFRVESGLLTVGYESYETFGERFGHLFYADPFSHYQLLVEYRFIGEQVTDGPDWAFKNSGVMFHAQNPNSMLLEQDFPISLELQLLGGNGTDARPTANLCTPGTEVEMSGVKVQAHCTNSTSETFHDDEWVTVELIVHADTVVSHLVNGEKVLGYEQLTIGGGSVDGFDDAMKLDGQPLGHGYIALQSESHPVQFRRVLLRQLTGG